MDPPFNAVEPSLAEAGKRDAQLQALRFKHSDEELTADQREVIRMLEDMDRGHGRGQRNGPPSIPSAGSRTSDADSSAAIKALAALGQDERITPPPLLALDNDHTGLPPTPPTMTSSEVAESKPARTLSPSPHIFADRVRNALTHSQRSGFSTPVTEAHSPPTPDRSPPNIRETLAVSRPQLMNSYSSYADSFKTAREGLSSGGSMSQLHSPIDEQLPKLNLLGVPARPGATSSDSDTGTATQTDGSDTGPVRVKNYQIESDSDIDRTASLKTGDSDEPKTSPTIQQALAHPPGYGFQHRLRAPIKPGDDIVRLDNALLYGSSNWKPRVTMQPVSKDPEIERDPTPRREMDTEALRNALPVHAESHTFVENATPQNVSPARSPLPSPTPVVQESSTQIGSAPEAISPATTVAGQAILEGNNATYQFIQRENAKRYSAISDGSGMQVVVVATPEVRRTLRHTPKRESLRGDISIASNSKRSSLDGSNHKLKHKRAMPSLGADSDEAGSPKVEPEEFYRRVVKPIPIANVSMPLNRPQHHFTANHGYRSLSGDTGADYLNRRTAFSGQNGYSHAPSRTPTLRRSVRGRGLDRVASLGGEGKQTRPWSADMTGKAAGLGMQQDRGSPQPKLRRTSAEKRLCNMGEVRRTSLDRVDELRLSPELKRDSDEKLRGRNTGAKRVMMSRSVDISPASPELRRTSLDQRLENNEVRKVSVDANSASIDLDLEIQDDYDHSPFRERRKSSDRTIPISPRRKSFDLRHLHTVETPLSISQFSGTEGDLCEARGVEIFPHNNDSLLLVHGNEHHNEVVVEEPAVSGARRPMFQAFLEPPDSPQSDPGRPTISVESPLTNPRAAPEPPKLVFIPPTPVDELDKQVGDPDAAVSSPDIRQPLRQRSSLTEKVRRYSASLVQPVPFGRSNSVRRQPLQRPQTSPEYRSTHLNPFWQPRDFWSEYSSSDDEEGYPADDRLPPGGDTSDVKEKRISFFPRSMSVRLPGFRGRGRFLQGNSLGIDRHGTNVRRHYVTKRTSEEMLQRMVERRRRRTFTLPFTGGTRVEYVGLAALGARVRDARMKRQERAAEKRRQALREQIGHPV